MKNFLMPVLVMCLVGCAGISSETTRNSDSRFESNKKLAVLPLNDESSTLADALISEFLSISTVRKSGHDLIS